MGSPDSGFEADTNTVTFFYKDGTQESLPTMKKYAVAHILLDRIVEKELDSKSTRMDMGKRNLNSVSDGK